MRFAHVSADTLVEQPLTESSRTAFPLARGNLLMIEGGPSTKMPFLKSRHVPKIRNPSAWFELRPLTQQFSFDASTGRIRGLMEGNEKTYYNLVGGRYMGVSMLRGDWINHVDVVVGDLPKEISWMSYPRPFVRVDPLGRLHALVIGKENGLWKLTPSCNIGYFAEGPKGWSAPMILGRCQRWQDWSYQSSERSLTFAERGRVFVSWVSENGFLVGRWLSPVPVDY